METRSQCPRWGLQVVVTAAGGSVRKNPKGREIGFGRGIRLTEAGRKHPMYIGKLDVFNAPTVHLDEVDMLPPGSTASMICGNCSHSRRMACIRTENIFGMAMVEPIT